MKNKLADLNDYLFEQIERLNDVDVTNPEKLKAEVDRSKAITGVADKIIGNADLVLQAAKAQAGNAGQQTQVPKMLLGEGDAGLVK